MDIEIGGDTFTKKPNILEEIAYRDTWGKGADSFIAMIYERLVLMRDLLAEDGSIYVHCDWRVNSIIRLVTGRSFRNRAISKRDYLETTRDAHKRSQSDSARSTTRFSYFTKVDERHGISICTVRRRILESTIDMQMTERQSIHVGLCISGAARPRVTMEGSEPPLAMSLDERWSRSKLKTGQLITSRRHARLQAIP